MRISKIIFCIVLIVGICIAQNNLNVPSTSTDGNYKDVSFETSAVFNAIGYTDGGVNKFTGNVSFPLQLDKITLNYNGSVRRTIGAPNNIIQSGWVGVGWTLTMGYIEAQNNGTRELNDDEYFFVSENGFSSKLIHKAEDEYILKDYKPWKIIRNIINGDIKGWTVIRDDGTIFTYGDNNTIGYGSKGEESANRCALRWGNWIGNGSVENGISHIIYQWDLSEVKDVYGNTSVKLTCI